MPKFARGRRSEVGKDMAYIALVHPPENGSSYGLTFPDLPGCATCGASREYAILMGKEALAGHLAALLANGDDVPSARSAEELFADPEVRENAQDSEMVVIIPNQNMLHRITRACKAERRN